MDKMLVLLRRRNRDYREVFGTDAGQRVMRDLHRFCVLGTPSADPNEAVFTMGMQRVFRRITALSNTSEETLLALANSQMEDDNDD